MADADWRAMPGEDPPTNPDEYLAPEEVEKLDLPKETADAVFALRDPEAPGLLFLIGTAHVSKQAAQDVEELINAAKPGVVGLELDPGRLKNVADMVHHPKEVKPPTSIFQVLKLLPSPQGWLKLFSTMNQAIHFYILGWPYGTDMLTAYRTAEAMGTVIAPIDRPSLVTLMRTLYELQQRMERPPRDRGGAQRKNKRLDEAANMMQNAAFQKVAKYCPAPELVIAAARRLLLAVMANEKPQVEDLVQMRTCARKVVDGVWRDALHSKDPAWDTEAVPAAIGYERDLLLAQELRRLTRNNMQVVGVVGAAHVPGIRHHWADALSPEKLALAEEYMKIPQKEQRSSASNLLGPALFLGGTGLLAYYRPRLLFRLTALTTGFAVTGVVITAANIAHLGKGLAKLGETAKELELREQMGGVGDKLPDVTSGVY